MFVLPKACPTVPVPAPESSVDGCSLYISQAVNSTIVDLLLYNIAVKQSTLFATCMPDPL